MAAVLADAGVAVCPLDDDADAAVAADAVEPPRLRRRARRHRLSAGARVAQGRVDVSLLAAHSRHGGDGMAADVVGGADAPANALGDTGPVPPLRLRPARDPG